MGLLDRVKASQAANGEEAPEAPSQAAPQPGTVATAPPPRYPGAPTTPPAPHREGIAQRAAAQGNQQAPGQLNPTFTSAKVQVHARLVEKYADQIDVTDRDFVREKIQELVDEYVRGNAVTMTRQERERLIDSLLNDVLGLGPLEPLIHDAEITEIMINHPKQIYIERKGTPMLSNVTFESNKQLMLVIDRIVSSIGRRVDESSPMCDARLKDGSRVNVIIPPLALKGPCMTIRKFSKEKLGPADLIKFGSASQDIINFMEACVRSRLNVLVSGGTGSGKTTLLNILSGFIPHDERIITCEDAAELQLQQDHVITLESRPPNVEGKGAIHIRDLVRNTLRMRPDRIIVGECRGGEALDMLQAMNTGHDGSMSTLHANSPHDALSRLETLVLMAGAELPSRAIREQVASAVNIIVQQQRLRGGARKIISIAEITGMENGEIQFHEIFTFKQVGVSQDGKAIGYHTATGIKPIHMEHFKASGEDLPESMFTPTPEPPTEKLY
jgi:pilus assembly protein CpaF